jgi:hypothetical protein
MSVGVWVYLREPLLLTDYQDFADCSPFQGRRNAVLCSIVLTLRAVWSVKYWIRSCQGLNLRRFARQRTHLEALPAVLENLHDVTDESTRKTHAPRALERGCGSIRDKRLGSFPPDKLGHVVLLLVSPTEVER